MTRSECAGFGKPWSYNQVWRVYQKAAKAAGIGGFGTHTLRHTYRSWLDSVGTPVGIQQKVMRHTDVRTTMRYGDAFTSDMAEAHGKVVGFALNRAQSELSPLKVVSAEGVESCLNVVSTSCKSADDIRSCRNHA